MIWSSRRSKRRFIAYLWQPAFLFTLGIQSKITRVVEIQSGDRLGDETHPAKVSKLVLNISNSDNIWDQTQTIPVVLTLLVGFLHHWLTKINWNKVFNCNILHHIFSHFFYPRPELKFRHLWDMEIILSTNKCVIDIDIYMGDSPTQAKSQKSVFWDLKET